MNKLNNIKTDFEVYLGKTQLSVEEIVKLDKGSVVELDETVDGLFCFQIGQKEIGKGEIIVLEKNLGLKIRTVLDNETKE